MNATIEHRILVGSVFVVFYQDHTGGGSNLHWRWKWEHTIPNFPVWRRTDEQIAVRNALEHCEFPPDDPSDDSFVQTFSTYVHAIYPPTTKEVTAHVSGNL